MKSRVLLQSECYLYSNVGRHLYIIQPRDSRVHYSRIIVIIYERALPSTRIISIIRVNGDLTRKKKKRIIITKKKSYMCVCTNT